MGSRVSLDGAKDVQRGRSVASVHGTFEALSFSLRIADRTVHEKIVARRPPIQNGEQRTRTGASVEVQFGWRRHCRFISNLEPLSLREFIGSSKQACRDVAST